MLTGTWSQDPHVSLGVGEHFNARQRALKLEGSLAELTCRFDLD